MTTIKIENISKVYKKKSPIFTDFSLEITGGKIIGLFGENGIGKTTLLKMIADLAKQDSGSITIDGVEVSKATRDKVSWLLESKAFAYFPKVKDAIAYYKEFFADFDEVKSQGLINDFKIDINAKIKTLSKGQAERVCLMLCLSRKVPLYVLDEPMAGFDPKFKRDLINAILTYMSEGQTLLISSHLLKDLDNIIDEMIILTHNKAVKAIADEVRATGKSLEDFYMEVVE